MSAYSRGANFERRVRDYLVETGWVVFRSAGSKSPADLIALKFGETMLIQCKLGGKLSPLERHVFKMLGEELGVRVMLAWRENRQICLEEVNNDKADG